MSRVSVPPPLPTAERPRKPAEVPSHAEFLLDQVRASLAQLHKGHALDAVTYRDVEGRLSRAVLKEPPPSRESTLEVSEGDSEEVKLGKRNAWVRKTMAETDILPNIVQAALNTVAGPFLSGTAIDLIVELVSQSQKTIAETVTDPKRQQVATTSAFVGLKEAHGGMTRGIAAANTSLAEMKQKMEQQRLQAETKKQEKKERKDIKRELKEERSAIKEQMASGVGQGGLDKYPTRDVPTSSTGRAKDTDASCPACGKPMGQVGSRATDELVVAAQKTGEKPVAVNVTSATLGPSSSTMTTTFTALPDLRIVSTLVISGGHVVDDRALPSGDNGAKAMPRQTSGGSTKQTGSERTEPSSPDTRSPSRRTRDDQLGPPYPNADVLESQGTPRAIDRDAKTGGSDGWSRDSSLSDHEAAQSRPWQPSHPEAPRPADQQTPGTPRTAAPPVPPIPARPAGGERSVSSRSHTSNRGAPTMDSEGASTGFGQTIDVTDKKRKGWKNRLLS